MACEGGGKGKYLSREKVDMVVPTWIERAEIVRECFEMEGRGLRENCRERGWLV